MKKLFIFLINCYQSTPTHVHSMCRYNPTCSNYMKNAIEIYGPFKGVLLGIKRILRCHPFGKSGYDPVPIKEEKK